VVVDSIQTVWTQALESAPGSVSQVRESAGRLMLLAKGSGIPIFIVGMAFLAAKSDAETKKKYDQQHAEIAKKFEKQKNAESAIQSE
jgi:hypothetical protein